MMKKKYLFFIVILIQISIVGILYIQIYNKQNIFKTVSKTIIVNPLKKEDYFLNQKLGDMKYFYEPKPNRVIKSDPISPNMEKVNYTINQDRLNQINNYTGSKNKSTYRIITIGDSFTFGVNVNTKNNYPSQLEQLLNTKLSCPTIKKFEVLNLGVGGYDIQYTVERFKLRGIKYHPDLVFWLLIPDDFRRINELVLPKLHENIIREKQNKTYSVKNEKELLLQAKNDITKELGGENNVLLFQTKYLKSISDFYSEKLVLTTFPNIKRDYQDLLENITINKTNIFLNNKLPNIWAIKEAALPDAHPSEKGHMLIAENLLHYLTDNKLIPCSIKKNDKHPKNKL